MERDAMQKMIGSELERIPRREDGSHQNAFRSAYQEMREHGLSQNPATPRAETFRKVLDTVRNLEAVRKESPDFFPECDKGFFGY